MHLFPIYTHEPIKLQILPSVQLTTTVVYTATVGLQCHECGKTVNQPVYLVGWPVLTSPFCRQTWQVGLYDPAHTIRRKTTARSNRKHRVLPLYHIEQTLAWSCPPITPALFKPLWAKTFGAITKNFFIPPWLTTYTDRNGLTALLQALQADPALHDREKFPELFWEKLFDGYFLPPGELYARHLFRPDQYAHWSPEHFTELQQVLEQAPDRLLTQPFLHWGFTAPPIQPTPPLRYAKYLSIGRALANWGEAIPNSGKNNFPWLIRASRPPNAPKQP